MSCKNVSLKYAFSSLSLPAVLVCHVKQLGGTPASAIWVPAGEKGYLGAAQEEERSTFNKISDIKMRASNQKPV